MKQKSVAVVGAAETTNMGKIPNQSVIGLHADAALNAMRDAGLTAKDIDGVATAGESPVELAHYLGITPTWADGTSVGGCSFMLHVRHAAAAINEGLCNTVLITHAESGRSRIGTRKFGRDPASQMGQFEVPYGVTSPPTMFTIPVLRYMKEVGVSEEDLAMVAVIQREWAAKNPRASFRDPITVDDVLNSSMIAWPFRKLMCCLVTDGGGALILTSAERAKDFPQKPVYILGTGESVETPMVSQMADFTSSKAFRVSGKKAFEEAGIKHSDVDHLMIYDAFAHLPLYGLEDLGFCKRGEAAAFIRERNTAPGGKLPLNTNGGGLSYMHSGMYGMYALQESVRQMRGIAPAQVPGAKISIAHGVGGMFAASGHHRLFKRKAVIQKKRPRMNLAKSRIDIGLFTNRLDAMLAFYQNEVGIAFDHALPLGGGQMQHRHDLAGSVLKINASRTPIEETPASGYCEILIARDNLLGPKTLHDPDGNKVTLVPRGLFGIKQIGIKLKVRDVNAHRRFYAIALGLPDVPEEGGDSFYCGESVIMVENAADAPSDAAIKGTGMRYITVQVFDADKEYDAILGRGGHEGTRPRTLGEVARFGFVRDPDGNWIEISQRFSLVGKPQ